ncbi:MAG: hypothetical protein Q8W47_02075 [Candidatus Palauibacterales bacterium]|nr:hypothetical protein [Candidatus Palauibacterales bacterium]
MASRPSPSLPDTTDGGGGFILGPDHAGIGIGDVPLLHGLRLNFRDARLRHVDGIAFSVRVQPTTGSVAR